MSVQGCKHWTNWPSGRGTSERTAVLHRVAIVEQSINEGYKIMILYTTVLYKG